MEIYKISNLVTNMYYIGQTRSNKETRWKGHIKDSKRVDRTFNKNSHLYNAMRFYGSENFSIETLCECPDQEALDAAETFFIWFMGARKRSIGYNIASGGSHGKCSEETKEKISAANKGRVQTEEEKKHNQELQLVEFGGWSLSEWVLIQGWFKTRYGPHALPSDVKKVHDSWPGNWPGIDKEKE